MEIHRKDIFDRVVANADRAIITHYYSYNTGTVGSSYIAEAENRNLDNETANKIAELVEKFLDEATERLGIGRDNKTAVKCTIPEIEQPVYFVFYDTKYVICFEIARRQGTEYEVPALAKPSVHTGGHHGEGDE